MAFKGSTLFSCILLLLVLFATNHAKRDTPNNNKTSPFEFINNLKGYHKGNTSKEIHHLKKYLQQFGYLHQNSTNDDNFDDALEAAIKTYQHNFRLEPTGVIDDETLSKMVVPRCGVPDIINGTNFMQDRKKRVEGLDTVSLFTFANGNRWPQTDLTYDFYPNTPSFVMGPVARAFDIWASATLFTFSPAQDSQSANLLIGWFSGAHGDDEPFGGPDDTVLAHSFPPTSGDFHYNADKQWYDGIESNSFDLESVAVHEIGHLLGLGHSDVPDAVMYPSIPPGITKRNLKDDDTDGIKALYND